MSPFDRLLARRSLLLAVLLFGVVSAVVVATDEPGSTLGMRVARLAALLPALAVGAEMLTLEQARARGELAALHAVGASPWRVTRGARVAGWLVALVAIGLAASPWADTRALFPALQRSSAWIVSSAGLVEPGSGVTVTSEGAIVLARETAQPALGASPGRTAALYCIAPLALIAPVWGAQRLELAARLPTLALSAVAAIVLLHAVAASRLPPAALLAAASPLALQALWALARRRSA